MTDVTGIQEELAAVRQRLADASPRPWTLRGDEWISVPVDYCTCGTSGGAEGHERGCGLECVTQVRASTEDADLIANAPSDIAGLLAALEAVLELHKPDEEGDCAGCGEVLADDGFNTGWLRFEDCETYSIVARAWQEARA